MTDAVFLVAAAILVFRGTAPAQEYDPPIATLVTNMDQPSGSDEIVCLSESLDGLSQGFTTGPSESGYELTSILMYVRDTHESRYMTILAGLYHDDTKVADLTRAGSLNDFAHNEWLAPPDTYLQPNTHYHFLLDCVDGCANDNKAQFGVTYSSDDDPGAEEGWTVEDHLGFRKSGDDGCYYDPSKALRIRIKGRTSTYRAYNTEIVSTPADGDTYLYGEHIDIALTFTSAVYVPEEGGEIGLRIGETVDGPTYRAAEYLAGSLTNRLVYRYRVQMGDSDANGISVDAGGPDSGYGRWVPTIVASFGLLPVDRYFPGVEDAGNHKVDGSLHVTDAAITSRPAHGDGYRLGEEIEVTLTFSTEAIVGEGSSSIAILVGDDDSNYRAARYVSGSGTKRLVYRYQVQFADFDATGIRVDSGGPNSGFGGTLPTTSPELGSVPASRGYPGLDDDSSQKVARSTAVSFDAEAYTISENGTAATVTVELDPDPGRPITIPITAAPRDGAAPADYSLSATSLDFAAGETSKSFTATAVDDSEDDDGESLTIAFGTLPSGVGAGSRASAVVSIADNDGAATGQTVTIWAVRDACLAALDDVIFNLTLAEASDEVIAVNVTLAQEQPFLNAVDLTQRVEFPANATAAELRIPAERQNDGVILSGALTATVVEGAGYHIGTPAAASVRMEVGDPALIARLGQSLYSFEEEATGAEARFEVIMETQPGLPAPNRSHEVTVATESRTAESGTDFTPVNATVTFAPEEYSSIEGRWVAQKWIEVPLIDDDADELEELFTVTLSRDPSLSDRIQVRNPNRTRCDGPCRSRIAIVDNDRVGVVFLDGDGNPLTDLRLSVREGERVTYRIRLDRAPAQWMTLAWEPGEGDPDLVSRGEQSWRFSPAGDLASHEAHDWQSPVPLTVEALQDNDAYSGERRFHHSLTSDDLADDRVELPDVVIVEIDNEGGGPLRIFGVPEVVSRPASEGDSYGLGERVEIQVTFTRPVRVTGSPYLEFDLGNPGAGSTARANFAGGDGTQDILFAYTVGPDDWDDDGIEIGSGAIRLNEGAIRSETGEDAALDHPAAGVQPGHRIRGQATLSVADARVREEAEAALEFAVTLSREASETVTVDFATADGTAAAGRDYTAAEGSLTFAPGETEKTVSVEVLDDAHDEGEETLTLTLNNASGARIADDTGTGTIENADPLQRAWLARFGRTAAQRILDGVQTRLDAPREAGIRVTFAGHALGGPRGETAGSGGTGMAARDRFAAVPDRFGPTAGKARVRPRSPEPHDLVTGSAFTLSQPTGGGLGTLWGRGAWSAFRGSADALALDGGVTTAMVGADYAIGGWVVGLPLTVSLGDGSWRSPGRGEGRVASSLTGLYPYAGYRLDERLSLWGTAGFGQGGLTFAMQDGESYRTDMDLAMAAAGLRGDLVSRGPEGGPSLAIESDALLVRTTSAAASGPSGLLAPAVADVSRLRLGLEGSLELALSGGESLRPAVELGLRHDGGDAESGFGLEIGGGSGFTDAARGLTAQVSVRGLVAHQATGFRDWGVAGWLRFDPRPSSKLGPSVSLTPSWGAPSAGGVEALFQRETLSGLALSGSATPVGRLDAEAAYGFAVLGGRVAGTPYLGVGRSAALGEVRVGCRLQLTHREGLELDLEGTRHVGPAGEAPKHGVMLRLALR